MEGDMPKKNMGLKRKNLTGYMGGGVFKSNAPVSSSFRSGGATEVGTEKKVQSYKKYAKKMFGGGISQPSRQVRGSGPSQDNTTGMQNDALLRTPKKIRKRRPTFTPTKADDRGLSAGGALTNMRKKIIGIKKDRGLTSKSGARKGMKKKRVTRRGGG